MLQPRIAWNGPRDPDEHRRRVRLARRAVAVTGRYDVGRLADVQVLAIASRDEWEFGLDRCAPPARSAFARGAAVPRSASSDPEWDSRPEPIRAESAGDSPPVATRTWIEIEVVDEDGVAYAGESYRLGAPDGRSNDGRLDDEGRFRLDGIPAGTCRFDFPELVSAALED